MSGPFNLISLREDSLFVSHVNQVLVTSPDLSCDPTSDSSIIDTVSQAFKTLGYSARDSAFILPSFWVGADGKIIPQMFAKIESLCRSLHLHPLGFLSHDEAIVEEANAREGVPVSFIILDIYPLSFHLTLAYLGQIKERQSIPYTPPLSPPQIESALAQFTSDSTLPPSLIVTGQFNDELINRLQNYPWLNKKTIDVFLHHPDITPLSRDQLIEIYLKIIRQELVSSPVPSPTLVEVDAESLGFTSWPLSFVSPSPPKINFHVTLPRFHFSLPKLHRPPFRPSFLLPFLLLFLLPLSIFLARADITLYLNPYPISLTVPLTLSTENHHLTATNLPVSLKTLDLSASASLPTTAQKIVGDKAKGEMIIYNKIEKTQSLSRGSILTDTSGKKFELLNQTIIASASADLVNGVIKLGQTRSLVNAVDIGPEFNLSKNTKFTFIDQPETVLIAQNSEDFSGGSRSAVKVVSLEDKTNLDAKLTAAIQENLDSQIHSQLGVDFTTLRESYRPLTTKTDYNREINEPADNLEGTLHQTASILVNLASVSDIVTQFIKTDPRFSGLDLNPSDFRFSFRINQYHPRSSSAVMTLQGSGLPQIDLSHLRSAIAGKSRDQAIAQIQRSVDRLYNYPISVRFWPKTYLPLLPQRLYIKIVAGSQ